jgi:hypothetical protein
MELLEKINEFLMKTMPEESRQISLKLKENNFRSISCKPSAP